MTRSKLDDIRAVRARLIAELKGLTPEQGAWHPEGEWSQSGNATPNTTTTPATMSRRRNLALPTTAPTAGAGM